MPTAMSFAAVGEYGWPSDLLCGVKKLSEIGQCAGSSLELVPSCGGSPRLLLGSQTCQLIASLRMYLGRSTRHIGAAGGAWPGCGEVRNLPNRISA